MIREILNSAELGIKPNTVDLNIPLKLLPLDGGGWVGVKKERQYELDLFN